MQIIPISSPDIGEEEIREVCKVLRSGRLAQGEMVERFEREFAKYIGVKYGVAVCNGTVALFLALKALEVGEGDEVVTAPFSFVATCEAIIWSGAKPVFVDIDPLIFNIDPAEISGAITKKTKAIIPVHLYGQPADMERVYNILINGSCRSPAPKSPAKGTPILGLPELAPPVSKIKVTNPKIKTQRKRIYIIEDCAQAHGAEIKLKTQNSLAWPPGQAKLKTTTQSLKLWKKVGSIGDVGCFSFYATKNMTTGEGGMITTNNKEIYENCLLLRNHGSKEKYKHEFLGGNFRMTEIQAALGLVQLKKLDKNNKKRQKNAFYLTKHLEAVKGIITSKVKEGTKHAFHQYTIRITKDFPLSRDLFVERLREKKIGAQIYYPIPLHRQPFMKNYQKGPGSFPESERAAREVVSLPIHAKLTERQLVYIVKVIKKMAN